MAIWTITQRERTEGILSPGRTNQAIRHDARKSHRGAGRATVTAANATVSETSPILCKLILCDVMWPRCAMWCTINIELRVSQKGSRRLA
jgi:hypothetical protein